MLPSTLPPSGEVSAPRRRMSGPHKELTSRYHPKAEKASPESMEELKIPTKLIYKGTIEVHLFEHIESSPCILELVPYDKNTGQELNHVYLAKDAILPRISTECQRRIEAKINSLNQFRSRSSKISSLSTIGSSSFINSDTMISEDITNEVIGEYLLARLQLIIPDGVGNDSLHVRVKQTSSELEDPKMLSIIVKRPEGKTDFVISRPRRPSLVEFDSVLKSFNADADILQRASSEASEYQSKSMQAIAELQIIKNRPRAMSIDDLMSTELKACQLPTPQKLTPKERWIKTINAINSQKNQTYNDNSLPEKLSSGDAAKRGRAGRETFPNPSIGSAVALRRSLSSPLYHAQESRNIIPSPNRWVGTSRSPASAIASSLSSPVAMPRRTLRSSPRKETAGGALPVVTPVKRH